MRNATPAHKGKLQVFGSRRWKIVRFDGAREPSGRVVELAPDGPDVRESRQARFVSQALNLVRGRGPGKTEMVFPFPSGIFEVGIKVSRVASSLSVFCGPRPPHMVGNPS